MMGERRVVQEALVSDFNLGRHVPANHFLRAVDLAGLGLRLDRKGKRRRPLGVVE